MSLKIVTYPNPLLGKPSLPITEVTDEIRKLAEEMTEAMYKSDGIGIAAPQVGRLIRLVIIDVTGPEKREGKMVLVNPVWTPLPDAGYVESEEGCLSVPDYRSKVRRTARVHVEATDLDGNPVSFDADDILAICVQHEIDHLDGKLFIACRDALYEVSTLKPAGGKPMPAEAFWNGYCRAANKDGCGRAVSPSLG